MMGTEIEAKFVVTTEETLRRLAAVERLAGFDLSAPQVKEVHDTYLDTADRAFLAAGYALRRRKRGDGISITVKTLSDGETGIHRRQEIEVHLPADGPPDSWPEGQVRDWVQQVSDGTDLSPLFELVQTRTVRQVRRDGQPIAELSLDHVRPKVSEGDDAYFEVEAELTEAGTEANLQAIAVSLQDDWGLRPEPRSKFERALELLQEQESEGTLLSSHQRAVCLRVARREDMYGRRARALLALDEGKIQAEAGADADLSPRRVRHWLAAFREKQLDVFPTRVLACVTPPSPSEPTAVPAPELPTDEGPESRESPAPAEPPQPTVELSPQPGTGEGPKLEELTPATKPPAKPGLEPDDTMVEAARKTLYFHFARMLYHEPGTRLGDDIEELHDMRVATRRMRAAIRVFGEHLNTKQLRPLRKGLRRTGRALGGVRDLDVFWEKTEDYLDTLPEGRRDELAPLRRVWEVEHQAARERMLKVLDGDRYNRFKERFGEFLRTPGAGALPPLTEKGQPIPTRLKYIVPILVYQRLASIRAYDDWVTQPDTPMDRLHRLRIDAKRLRYTLEFFREVLGPDTKALIKRIKGLQNHLGDLQDAVVASNLLRDFLTWGTWGHAQPKGEVVTIPTEPIIAPGVAAYLSARQSELQRLLETFPQAWEPIRSQEFVQLVAKVLVVL